ncbi:MAG: tetratricopeptide repeat protein [Candidatus Cloacimonadia bacterium]
MDKKTIKAHLLEAEHHRKTNWLLAVDILEEIIREEPKALEAHEMLYNIYMDFAAYKKAEWVLKRALSDLPENDFLYFLMGNLYLTQGGKTWQAIESYEKVKKRFPELEFNLAVALAQNDRPGQASSLFEKVFPHFQNIAPIYIMLAEQYIPLGKYEKALRILQLAEQKFPTNKDVFYLKGRCFYYKNNWIAAYLALDKARELGCHSAEFFNDLARTSERMGDVEKAIFYFKKSIGENAFFVRSYLDLCKLYLAKEDFKNAKKYLVMAHRLDPSNIFVMIESEKLKSLQKPSTKK